MLTVFRFANAKWWDHQSYQSTSQVGDNRSSTSISPLLSHATYSALIGRHWSLKEKSRLSLSSLLCSFRGNSSPKCPGGSRLATETHPPIAPRAGGGGGSKSINSLLHVPPGQSQKSSSLSWSSGWHPIFPQLYSERIIIQKSKILE